MTRGVCTNLPSACSKAAARTLLPCGDHEARCPDCGAALLPVADGASAGRGASARWAVPALVAAVAIGAGWMWQSGGRDVRPVSTAPSTAAPVAQAAVSPVPASAATVTQAVTLLEKQPAAAGPGPAGALSAVLATLGPALAGELSDGLASEAGSPGAVLRRIAPMAEDQQAGDVLIGRDALAVVVHSDSPLQQLGRIALRDLLAGRVREGARIGAAPGAPVVHLREAGGEVDALLARQVLGEMPLAKTVKRHDSEAALLAAVVADPHAVGVVPRSSVTAGVRAIAITDTLGEAWLPTVESVAAERYPLSHRLVLRSSGEVSPAAQRLARHLTAAAAQARLAAGGLVALAPVLLDTAALAPVAAGGSTTRWPRDYTALTRSARPLAGRVAFAAGSDELDGVATADIERIAAHLKAQPAGAAPVSVIVLGMANDPGGFCGNRTLSERRATRVAEALSGRGVTVRVARGVGRIAPHTTPVIEDGALDRRVEIWLADGPVQPPGPFKCTPGPAFAHADTGEARSAP